MEKLLYITANPQKITKSSSLWVGEKFLNEYMKLHPNDEIVHIDLSKENIPTLDKDSVNIWNKLKNGLSVNDLTKKEQKIFSKFEGFVNQFMSADKYIFVNPMWNHFLPSKLKDYLDTISILGKTIRYTSNGPIGLLHNKKALHIQSCGGVYFHEDSETTDFGHKYLKYIMKFLGAESTEAIFIDGLEVFKDKKNYIKKQASKKAIQLAKSF